MIERGRTNDQYKTFAYRETTERPMEDAHLVPPLLHTTWPIERIRDAVAQSDEDKHAVIKALAIEARGLTSRMSRTRALHTIVDYAVLEIQRAEAFPEQASSWQLESDMTLFAVELFGHSQVARREDRLLINGGIADQLEKAERANTEETQKTQTGVIFSKELVLA